VDLITENDLSISTQVSFQAEDKARWEIFYGLSRRWWPRMFEEICSDFNGVLLPNQWDREIQLLVEGDCFNHLHPRRCTVEVGAELIYGRHAEWHSSSVGTRFGWGFVLAVNKGTRASQFFMLGRGESPLEVDFLLCISYSWFNQKALIGIDMLFNNSETPVRCNQHMPVLVLLSST
jgi:hypothetical protein